MSINYTNKQNERLIGFAISAEPHVIGIVGVAVVAPGVIRLIEVPQAPAPSSTVSIPGYTEIFTPSPTGTQFYVDYTTGVITFDLGQEGYSVSISYIGLGSEFAAEDVNELQGPVGIALNYDGSLTSHIVKPVSISNLGTDDFTFPRDVSITREAKAVDFITASASPASTGVVRLAATDAIDFGTSNYALTTDGSGNLTWRGNTIASGSGSVTSIIGTSNQVIASASVGAVTLSTPQDINTGATPTFASETLSATSNQLILGTTRTITITAPTPATSSRVVTVPDPGTAANFVLSESSQTLNGALTFTNTLTSIASSGNTLIVDTNTLIVDATNHRVGIGNSSPATALDIIGAVTQVETYSVIGYSHQGIAGDETLDPGVGSSNPTNPKFIASAMFNVHDNGSPLTATANYLAGIIGADSITGAKATTYPKGAVLAQISDGVTDSDGAVVAYVDGDSSVTLANAAFKAMQNNSQVDSGFTYGLDLYGAAHDGYLELSIKNADLRLSHEICIFSFSTTPIDGITGAGYAEIGSMCVARDTGKLYLNKGSKASPIWGIVTSA